MTIILIGYLIASLIAIRPLTGHLAWIMFKYSKGEYPYSYRSVEEPKPSNWVSGFCIAVLACGLWPAMLFWQIADRTLPKIGYEKEHELRKEIEARKQRDKQLGLPEWEYGGIEQ